MKRRTSGCWEARYSAPVARAIPRSPCRRWRGGPRSTWQKTGSRLQDRRPRLYNAHETERMQELDGVELASFTSRAVAFLIDFVIAGALFLAVLLTTAKLLNKFTSLGQNNQRVNIELNFF